MTLIQQIDALCEQGLYPVLTDKEETKFKIVIPHKDEGGDWHESYWGNSIELAEKSIRGNCGDGLSMWRQREQEGDHILRDEYGQPVCYNPPAPKGYKVGDRVFLSWKAIEASGYDTSHWGNSLMAMINTVQKIGAVNNFAESLHYRISGWYIRHEWLIPVLEEETITMTKEEAAKKIMEALGGKRVIIG